MANAIAEQLGIPVSVDSLDSLSRLRTHLQTRIREQFRTGEINWELIDALPGPDELRE